MTDKIKGLTYGLVTTVVGLEIHQALTREDPLGRLAADVSRWIFDTREEGIRKALIELGWTPPAQDFIPAPRPSKDWRGGHEPHCNLMFPSTGDAPCDCAKSKPKPKLEICEHTGGLTYTPGGPTNHRCNTCDLPLSIEEVRQANERHRAKGFPYG